MLDTSPSKIARSGRSERDKARLLSAAPDRIALPQPMQASTLWLPWANGKLALMEDGSGPPLLLIHSVNAAASSYEVKPIFEAMKARRRVFALDLPGFGLSSRGPSVYTVGKYVEAILLAARTIQEICGGEQVAALALSLSGEFLARAVRTQPELFAGLALVTPTGFEAGSQRRNRGAPDKRGKTALEGILNFPLWRTGLFRILVSRPSVRFFLRRTFGDTPDPGLVDYAWHSAHQPGAAFAAFAFASGKLFSPDIRKVYEDLDLPVWLAHGTRGSFADFTEADWTLTRSNWRQTSFKSGAFPHFQATDAFMKCLESFLDGLLQGVQPAKRRVI